MLPFYSYPHLSSTPLSLILEIITNLFPISIILFQKCDVNEMIYDLLRVALFTQHNSLAINTNYLSYSSGWHGSMGEWFIKESIMQSQDGFLSYKVQYSSITTYRYMVLFLSQPEIMDLEPRSRSTCGSSHYYHYESLTEFLLLVL